MSSNTSCSLHKCSLATFDFTIVNSNIPGISHIIPQNEDAYSYLVEETLYTVFQDGTTALFDERVPDFVSDAGWSHLTCDWELQSV